MSELCSSSSSSSEVPMHPADACIFHWRHVLCVSAAAALLGVDPAGLEHALTTRSRVMREGVIVSPLNVRSAVENRQVLQRWNGNMTKCYISPCRGTGARDHPGCYTYVCGAQSKVVDTGNNTADSL
jgi:hypothetical protein